MDRNKPKTVGIIGGMGPAATCDLMEKIIAHTKAASDQEHLHMIVDVNTDIPDRTAAILRGGPDPVLEIVRSAKRLESAGAELLLLACNTSHYFFDPIAASVSVPMLNMPEAVASALRADGVKKAGVLATDGTVRGGVYEKALAAEGIRAVYPSPEMQSQVMRTIYEGVKAKSVPLEKLPLREILLELEANGAEKFVLACTELPIAFAAAGLAERCVDATEILALAAIRAAGKDVREIKNA